MYIIVIIQSIIIFNKYKKIVIEYEKIVKCEIK